MPYVGDQTQQALFKGKTIHTETKKWGEEHWIVNKEYCGKKLILKKNRRCSMHTHELKDEVFYIQKGKVLMEIGEEKNVMEPGDFIHISPKTPHRFTGIEDSEIFEFSTNHQEDDSYRTEFSGHIDQDKFARQEKLVHSFLNTPVLIVGDVMLDTYIRGSVDRISPEAPIPVLHASSRNSLPGGAANAALNVASLGGRATLIGVRGADSAGDELERLLKDRGVKTCLIKDRSRSTTEKQRLMGTKTHQLVRVDFEDNSPVSSPIEKRITEKVEMEIKDNKSILLSDYAKGIFGQKTLKNCISIAKKNGKFSILDPKPKDASYLRNAIGVNLISPNKKESFLLDGFTSSSIEDTAKNLAGKLKTDVLLTLGGDGMMLSPCKGKLSSFPTIAQDVADVTGAGDTVSAVIALAVAAGGELSDAIDLANHAAGVAVSKAGAATVSPDELLGSL